MSGLYNMVFKQFPFANILLAEIGVDKTAVPRFRDCFLSTAGTIVIYTRTGGGNRADYETEIEPLTRNQYYLRNEDDSFDSTYALYHFRVPDAIKGACDELAEKGFTIDAAKRWVDTLAAMRNLT